MHVQLVKLVQRAMCDAFRRKRTIYKRDALARIVGGWELPHAWAVGPWLRGDVSHFSDGTPAL